MLSLETLALKSQKNSKKSYHQNHNTHSSRNYNIIVKTKSDQYEICNMTNHQVVSVETIVNLEAIDIAIYVNTQS